MRVPAKYNSLTKHLSTVEQTASFYFAHAFSLQPLELTNWGNETETEANLCTWISEVQPLVPWDPECMVLLE